MRLFALLLAATALAASPAVAQHTGHHMPQEPATKKAPTKKKPAAKKPAAKKAPAKKPAAKKTPVKKPTPKTPVQSQQQADPHAGHQVPAEPQQQPTDAHAGHQMSDEPPPQADPHAEHDMGQMAAPEVAVGPPPPEALSGPKNAADAIWGSAMERGRNVLRKEHGGLLAYKVFVDRAETRVRDGRDGYLFDAQAWYGGDIDKLWLKSEVGGAWGRDLDHFELQGLWSHAIGPWFDLQAGARFDPQPGPNRTHLVLGVQGLAPHWWEVEAAAFLSNKGELTARAEAEYDLRITQNLILQPRAEVELSAQDIEELGIGAGLSEASLGLRLRYRISPLVAPYIGVEYARAFGDTRDFRRADGDNDDGFNLLAGVRLWF
jgi:copper resistance protein B